MTGKIERPVNRAKVERTQVGSGGGGVETPSKTAAVSRTEATQNNAFSSDGPSQLESGGNGSHVARSARPDALWGGPERRGEDPLALMRLTPPQQVEKLKELRATRDQLHLKILDRVLELDKKWERAPAATKAEALKHYAEQSEQLEPEAKNELLQMIHEAEVAQQRINRLRRRLDGMPPARLANAEMKRQRAELNKELRAARSEQKEAVKDATAVVDDKGLKVDRLAVTEQKIDPTAPKPDSDKSLLGMVKSYFKVSWVFTWLSAKVSVSQAKKQDAELANQIQAQLLHDHQKEQAAKAEGLKELALEASLRKG